MDKNTQASEFESLSAALRAQVRTKPFQANSDGATTTWHDLSFTLILAHLRLYMQHFMRKITNTPSLLGRTQQCCRH